uniref:Uncharacterized protein n=1 Tax=Roseihalotalea indica TaxID=2867963 RepID=A0AA49GIN1_9BACT|nr:hypothetical protein K4G66_18505 [Tunicatimonas sp. TK19036]
MTVLQKIGAVFSKKNTARHANQFIVPVQNTFQNTVAHLEKLALDAGQRKDPERLDDLIADLNKAVDNIKTGLSYHMENEQIDLDASYTEADEGLHAMTDDDKQADFIEEYRALQQPDLNEDLSQLELEMKAIQREKKALNNELVDAQSRKALAERQNATDSAQGRVNARNGLVISVFIGLLEVAASTGPFTHLGEGMMAGLGVLLAVGVSSMLVLTSHQGGRAWAKKNFAMAWAWLLIGALLLTAVIALRFWIGEAGLIENTIISAILIALYAASWLLALRYWKAWALTLHQKEIDALFKKLEALQKLEDKKTSAINNKKARHDVKIRKELNTQKQRQTAEHRRTQLAVKKLENDRNTAEIFLDQLRENAVAKLRQMYEEGTRIAKNGVYSLALLSMLLLGACDIKEASTQKQVVIVDISSSSGDDSLNTAQVVYDYNVQNMDLLNDEGWYGKAVEIQVMVVGDVPGGEELNAIVLAAPPILPLRNPKRRSREIQAFLAALKAELDHALAMRGTADKTQLNSTLVKALNELGRSEAQMKSVLILSDLVHDGYDVNFHSYKHNPRGLLADAHVLNAKLDTTGKLDSLSNITITVAYAGQKNKALFLAASEFWRQRFRARSDSLSVSVVRSLH